MKGDFSRKQSRKQYHSVLKQQGRVDLDADWNVHADMREALARAAREDVIGRSGAPQGDDAFRIQVTEDGEILLSPGRFYVDGILCEVNGEPVDGRVQDATRVRVDAWRPDGDAFRRGQWIQIAAPGLEPAWVRIDDAEGASRILTVRGDLTEFQSKPVQVRRLLTGRTQPHHAGVALKPRPGRTDLVYVDVWDRHVTAIEDPDLREGALGGPDTTTRIQTVWQVKVLPDPRPAEKKGAVACGTPLGNWPPEPGRARLSTDVTTPPPSMDPCEVTPSGGFRGVENRFYRVEVHDAGEPYAWPRPNVAATKVKLTGGSGDAEVSDWRLDGRPWAKGDVVEVFSDETDTAGTKGVLARVASTDEEKDRLTLTAIRVTEDLADFAGHNSVRLRRVASFKWSRDNGSVAFPVETFSKDAGDEVRVTRLGRDDYLALRTGDWVEVLGDEAELAGVPGTLAQVLYPDEAEFTLSLSKDVSRHRKERHPKVRRWDQGDDAIPVEAGEWVEMEDGVRVRFSGGRARAGDWWAFTARTTTADVERLEEAPPHGIEHHYARLGLVMWREEDDEVKADVTDCRNLFPPLTELPHVGDCCCDVTVGDGVESTGDYDNVQEALDSLEGPGTVCLLRGTHRLDQTVLLRKKRGVTFRSCDRRARVIAPDGEPAFHAEACESLTFEDLYVAASTPRGAIRVEESRLVNVDGCTVVNVRDPRLDVAARSEFHGTRSKSPKEAASAEDAKRATRTDEKTRDYASPGPAVLTAGTGDVRVEDCDLTGLPALTLQGECAIVRENRLTGGGVWVRDGATQVTLEGNDIGNGEGDAVALGGLLDDEKPSNRATGVAGVTIRENHLHHMGGSGIATMMAPSDVAALLGDVEDVLVEGNRIVECARQAPPSGETAWALGGIVLRDAASVRIHGNAIEGNGVGVVPACGVFTEGCRGMVATDNRVSGNGSVDAGPRLVTAVTFSELDVPRYGPNPRWVDGTSFLVEDEKGQVRQTEVTGTRSEDRGLDCGILTTVTLRTPSDFVDLRLRWEVKSPHVVAYDVDGREIPSRGQPRKPGEGWKFRGDAIAKVVIRHTGNAALLQSIRFRGGPAAYQAGIMVLGATPPPTPFAEAHRSTQGTVAKKFFTGKKSAPPGATVWMPRGDVRALEVGVILHDNVVNCPMGQALLVTALCNASVVDNDLRSGGPRDQPGLSRREHPHAGGVAFIHDLGRCPVLSNALLAFGARTGVHVEHAAATHSNPFPTPMGAFRSRFPGGRIRFEGNAVSYEDASGGQDVETCAVSLLSSDTVAAEANEVASELTNRFLVADVLGLAPAVRVNGNRVTELPLQAAHSILTAGLRHVVTSNQATHCITTRGNEAEIGFNQVLLSDACDLLLSPSGSTKKGGAAYANVTAAANKLFAAASKADADALAAVAAALKARAARLHRAAERLAETRGDVDRRVAEIRIAAADLGALAQEAHGQSTRAGRRPSLRGKEWIVFGRIVDEDGDPLPGLHVALVAEWGEEEVEVLTESTDEFGDFAFRVQDAKTRNGDLGNVACHIRVKTAEGQPVYATKDRVFYQPGVGEYFEIAVAPTRQGSQMIHHDSMEAMASRKSYDG